MRNCLVYVALLILLLGNGYAIFQIHGLKAEVAQLQQQAQAKPAAAPAAESLSGLANAALEALRRGDPAAAERELDRFSARVKQTRALAEARRKELEQTAARAKRAVLEKRREAEATLERLLREVPPGGEGEHPAKE